MTPAGLRVLRFRALGSETGLDVRLRTVVLPGIARMPGVLEAWAGRRRTLDDAAERCLAAVVAIDDPLVASLGEPPELRRLDPSLPVVEAVTSQVLPVAVAVIGDRPDPPRVLRVVDGSVRSDELPRYVREVEAGARADVMARHGPLRLYLAVQEPDRFLTISTWADWGDIQASTGSDARHPSVTRHVELLRSADVAHFELLPDDVPAAVAT
ncbi:MAG TPA: hypothetical protein VEY67_05860 [Candidatus Dormibacteraeota bacterium]|nr:hypothetical protein [Candidatus Dormibacteraeota bacterium]